MITRGHAVWFARNFYPTEKSYNGKKGRKRNEVLPPFSISLVNPSPLSSLMQRKVHKRRKIEKSERWLGKSQVAEKKKEKKRKEDERQSNPFTRFEADRSEDVMSSSHEGVPDHGSALTAGWFACPFVPRFFPSYTFNHNAFVKATIGSTRHWWFSVIYLAGGPSSILASTFLYGLEKMWMTEKDWAT